MRCVLNVRARYGTGDDDDEYVAVAELERI
jgi:hypothetical protein